jgi:CheY-like chemotaxis protein
MKGQPRNILLVEDNEDDVFLMRRTLRAVDQPVNLQVVTDGQRAMDYLSGDGAYADRQLYPVPCLVLMDLKLPFVDGFEVIAWMRQQPSLKDIPVVVLTSSAETRDQNRAYALGAKSYLVKPPAAETLNALFASLSMER